MIEPTAPKSQIGDLLSIQNNHPVATLNLTQDPSISNVSIRRLTFSPNGQLLALIGSAVIQGNISHFVWLWDTATYTLITSIHGIDDGGVDAHMAFSPDGKQLAITADTVHIYGVKKQ